MHFVATLTLAVAATAASASLAAAPITLAVTHVKAVETVKSVIQAGRGRLRSFNGKETSDLSEYFNSGLATNDDFSYVANVTVGGASWRLIVDTGSSNLWCGVNKPCEKTSTGKSTGNKFGVSYGSGAVEGTEYIDEVSFAGLTVKAQSLGAANETKGFGKLVDGIIGFGPVGLTRRTVANTRTVPTFMNNLYKQGLIPSEVLGVSFRPETGSSKDSVNGELTLGGTDSTKYNGSISYVPTLKKGLAANFWGVAIDSFAYGSKTLGSNGTAIVDTGTTLIYLPEDAFKAFLTATGGSVDRKAGGLATYTQAPTENFVFTLGSTTLTLTPSQYLIPNSQYKDFKLASGKYYAWLADGGDSGIDCIIGQKFLENYYAVFDTTNSRIGFAPAA